jgi:fructokinase
MLSLQGDVRRRIEGLRERFRLTTVVLTRGPGGRLIYHEGCWSEQPPQSLSVLDTVGAGDAFTAALTMGMLNKWDLAKVHTLAAEVARYVCSQTGGTPALPVAFRRQVVGNSLA